LAEAKVLTPYPAELKSRLRDSLIDGSSSTTNTVGIDSVIF